MVLNSSGEDITNNVRFNWSSIQANPNANQVTNLEPGSYSVTITDKILTCSLSVENILIKAPSPLAINCFVLNDASASGAQDGTAKVDCSNGTPPYTINWDGPISGETSADAPGLNTLDNLPAGVYFVTVIDICGLVQTCSFTINDTPCEMLVLIDSIIPDIINQYGEQGRVKGRILNASPPYDILWSGGPSGSMYQVNNPNFTILNLNKGSYGVEVRDSRGCSTISSVFVDGQFVFGANQEMIIDYSGVLDRTKIPPFMDTLRTRGANLIDTCHCENGAWLLQHWRNGPEDIIIIDNTPPEGAQSSTKSDDNGWYGGITTPKEEDKRIKDPENCKYMPGQGSGQKYRVKVAIIDSGVNLRYHNRPNSGHPALTGLDWTNDEPDDLFNCIAGDLNGYDFVNKTANVIDNVGHGTHIAGAIADAFPANIEMEFMNLKVYDKTKQGNVFGLTCAIHYAVSHEAQVINLSLGYYSQHPFEPLYNALHRADTSNILVVLSAGNDSIDIDGLLFNQADSLRWPATFKAQNIQTKDGKPLPPLKNLLTVASSAESGEDFLMAGYSNWGKTLVDIAINGLNTSTYLDTTYVTLKGTSMAAANVSREAALICAYDTTKILIPELIIKAMRNAPETFSGNTSKGIHATGPLDIDSLYRSIHIDPTITPVEREVVHPPGGPPFVSLYNPQRTSKVGEDGYYLRLGNGKIYYDDVTIIVKGGSPLKTYYEAKFCSVNGITWFGQDNEGKPILQEGTYFISITINGTPTTPSTMPVVIDNN